MSGTAFIKKVDNGYVVKYNSDEVYAINKAVKVYTNFRDAMQDLLGHFENKGTWQVGEFYGKVEIIAKKK